MLALIQKITREEGIITVLGLGFGDLGSRLNLYILLHFFAVINTPHLINLKKKCGKNSKLTEIIKTNLPTKKSPKLIRPKCHNSTVYQNIYQSTIVSKICRDLLFFG